MRGMIDTFLSLVLSLNVLYLFIQKGTIIPGFAGEQMLGMCFGNLRSREGSLWQECVGAVTF